MQTHNTVRGLIVLKTWTEIALYQIGSKNHRSFSYWVRKHRFFFWFFQWPTSIKQNFYKGIKSLVMNLFIFSSQHFGLSKNKKKKKKNSHHSFEITRRKIEHTVGWTFILLAFAYMNHLYVCFIVVWSFVTFCCCKYIKKKTKILVCV